MGAMEDRSSKQAGVAVVADLHDDLLVEILSRVPAKSICRFKCVSKAWLDLIAGPDHRKKLRQPMQGLIFMNPEKDRHSFSFLDLPLTVGSVPLDVADPAGFISFLTEQPGIHRLVLLDSCNGLILFQHLMELPHYNSLGYVVCNPTTKQWRAVPEPDCSSHVPMNYTYLAFDPTVSSHFHLVRFKKNREYMEPMSVHAYSSKTGIWTYSQTEKEEEEWQNQVYLSISNRCAFVNGFLHLLVWGSNKMQILIVDVQGRPRRMIRLPDVAAGNCEGCYCVYFGQSQGHLHCITKQLFDFNEEKYELSIWALLDYDAQEWVLKDTVSSLQLFGGNCPTSVALELYSEVASMHLDRNVVFFFSHCERRFIAYDMDSKEVSVFSSSKAIHRWKVGCYVPCFSPAPLK